MRFTARQRLKGQKAIRRVHEQGHRVQCGCFVVVMHKYIDSQEVNTRRLTVIASRKVGNAVKRHRAKRLFREIFRLFQDNLPAYCDVIIIAYPNFSKYPFAKLKSRFLKACQKFANA